MTRPERRQRATTGRHPPAAAPAAPRDGGSIAVELALALPLMAGLLLVLVGAFHLGRGVLDVNTAAAAAARAASLARTAPAARTAAQDTATAQMAGRCAHLAVAVDTSAFHRGGQVTVVLACAVTLRSTTGIPLPGTLTLRAASTNPLDFYRAGNP